MSNNPCPAFPNTSCDSCGEEIIEGDNVYLFDGERFCEDCANEEKIVCDCGNMKKPQYQKCYNCKIEDES